MECITFTTCGLQYKRSNECKHRITNRLLAASRGQFCQQCKKIVLLTDENDHLETEDHKNKKKVWYCEACE